MSKSNNKSDVIILRVSDEEKNIIERKAAKAQKNLSEYIRQMSMKGYIIIYENDDIAETKNQIIGIANNINQIAKRVNATTHFYDEDIKELQQGVNSIWQSLNSIQSNLHFILQ